MPNVFFNNFNNFGEQDLIESLIVESIGIYGHQMYYIPRTIVAKDDIFNEDSVSEYNNAYLIDMYIKSYDSFQGDGLFLSKFNLEIRDQMFFTVAKRTFENEIATNELVRPNEGDLIYVPMMKRLFAISLVNKQAIFYQMGSLQTYDLTCEMFEYSNEVFNTGIPEIDEIEEKYSVNLDEFGLVTMDGFTIVDNNGSSLVLGQFDYEEQMNDVFAENDEFDFEDEKLDLVDWSERDPFSENIGIG